ncbi:MAG: DUF3047 domain-containing protein [Gammaproteobacteria bacterium]|nr:DUF3047 domain-containing protein [Gammaproteobacteria bacterium]
MRVVCAADLNSCPNILLTPMDFAEGDTYSFKSKTLYKITQIDGPMALFAKKHNVGINLKTAFAEEFTHINGIAVWSDTDNSGSYTLGYYGNLMFSGE